MPGRCTIFKPHHGVVPHGVAMQLPANQRQIMQIQTPGKKSGPHWHQGFGGKVRHGFVGAHKTAAGGCEFQNLVGITRAGHKQGFGFPVCRQARRMGQRKIRNAGLPPRRAQGHEQMFIFPAHHQRQGQVIQQPPPVSGHAMMKQPSGRVVCLLPVTHHLLGIPPLGVVLCPAVFQSGLPGCFHGTCPMARDMRHAPEYMRMADLSLVVLSPPWRTAERMGTSSTG